MPGEWWETFFSGLWLEIQRTQRAESAPKEADFIEKMLALRPGASVLDVPCGEGRLTVELASRGYRMTGVDITPALLEDARRRSAERNLSIAWQRRDMRDLPWAEAFDGAFCVWTSFGYFDDAGNRAFLEAVSRVLKPGARFFMETLSLAESLLPRFQERSWNRLGEIVHLEERHYDHVAGRINSEWTLVRDAVVERKSLSLRVYTFRELCQLMTGVGFRDFQAFGSLDGEPFGLGKRLYLVAAKGQDEIPVPSKTAADATV